MNHSLARKVADAVLYEGYMLYPYRPSAIKNRQRWSFGILYPPSYAEVRSGTERNTMHSECLFESTPETALHIQLRFLHLLSRKISKFTEDHFETTPSLIVNNQILESWDEGVERTLDINLSSLSVGQQHAFRFPGHSETELLRDAAAGLIGNVTRTQHEVTGIVSVSAQSINDNIQKLTIEVTNTTTFESDDLSNRDSALLCSLLSAHTIVTVASGQFISLLDPPPDLTDAAGSCKNLGNFPVLVGTAPERDMLLCSPIVLYDYPQIAPESASDFYDATEMDEMLTLRVMTLTDEEKTEMQRADKRVCSLLQRTEQTAREQLTRTHGIMRPVSDQS